MNNIEKARQIAMAYVQSLNMDVGEQMAELFLVKTDDERLLEHVEQIIVIMEEARKELRKGLCEDTGKRVSVREPYIKDCEIDGDVYKSIAKKYGIKS